MDLRIRTADGVRKVSSRRNGVRAGGWIAGCRSPCDAVATKRRLARRIGRLCVTDSLTARRHDPGSTFAGTCADAASEEDVFLFGRAVVLSTSALTTIRFSFVRLESGSNVRIRPDPAGRARHNKRGACSSHQVRLPCARPNEDESALTAPAMPPGAKAHRRRTVAASLGVPQGGRCHRTAQLAKSQVAAPLPDAILAKDGL